MKNFRYINTDSKAMALDILGQEKASACLVAGGTNVLPWIKDEILKDKTLINIRGLEELHFIRKPGRASRSGL